MKQYVYIDYPAIQEIISNRFFQSVEYDDTKMLVNILQGKSNQWSHDRICLIDNERGYIFLTKNSEKKRGVIFDLTRFQGFEEDNPSKVIAIFTKVLRYSVRYFDNLPLIGNERPLPNSSTTIVYPFPFVAQKDSFKVLIDRNSSKQDRKGKDFLTVFYYGNKRENESVSFTILRKMIEDLNNAKFVEQPPIVDIKNSPLLVTDLSSLELTIDSAIGIDNWSHYLTSNQRDFINKSIDGPERLEGAAGTGKTLTLILRAIRLLQNYNKENKELHLIFFTHSLSTKERIESVFFNNWIEFNKYQENDNGRAKQSILITTLQEWSMRHLGINRLSENEYLDKDASNSKFYQMMYIEEALQKEKKNKWNVYKELCSPKLISFIEESPAEYQIEVLQREFSEIIKGQAESQLEKYLKIERQEYSLPLVRDVDKRFVYSIFDAYQDSLLRVGQFDSDDIVLTALGQVNSPIWNRRRRIEGYDACFIDETHLFNLNEISLFHYVNKPERKNTIIYAIDRAQAIGDTYHFDKELIPDKDARENEKSLNYSTVFRSSPEISSLAFSVLTSGATFFRNFQNPLESAIFTFTSREENKLRKPMFIACIDDLDMFDKAFKWASEYSNETHTQRNSILFVPTTDNLLNELTKYAEKYNKPFVTLQSRADINAVKRAKTSNKYVIGGIDYIGGLEFDVVIIIGADQGRIPPNAAPGSMHVLRYAWYNRLYVAITRAKYAVTIIGDSSGISPLLESSLDNHTIDMR